MNDVLQTSIEFLKGVGPQRAKLLRDELGIATFEDLLSHYPFRYVDRSQYNAIRDLPELDGYVQLKGKIISLHESGNGRQKRLSVKFQDETGIIDLVWFQGIKFILPSIKVNVPLQVFGKPKFYQSSWSIPHPEITLLSEVDPAIGWQPVYSSTEKLTAAGLHSKGIQKLMLTLLAQLRNVAFEDAIPVEMRTELGLIPYKEALFAIHIPQATEQVQLAQRLLQVMLINLGQINSLL
jgi:ATP-dependent DNA helicase RecG